MPQIAICCCPMIGQSSAGPRSASQFMHHRGGKFIFKGNVSAAKRSDQRRRPPCGGLLVTSSHLGFRRQPACCRTTLTTVSACSDRPVQPYSSDEAPRSYNLHPLHQTEGQCHANSFDDQRSCVWPLGLVIPLPTYRVAIQAEFASSVSKARDTSSSITLRPPVALAEDATADYPPMTGRSSA